MKYYDSKTVAEFTGYCQKTGYKIIYKLNEELHQEYPELRIIKGKIPIWFWNKKMEPEKQNTELNQKGT